MQGELDFWIGIFLLDINTDFSLLGRFVFAALQEGMHGLLGGLLCWIYSSREMRHRQCYVMVLLIKMWLQSSLALQFLGLWVAGVVMLCFIIMQRNQQVVNQSNYVCGKWDFLWSALSLQIHKIRKTFL